MLKVKFAAAAAFIVAALAGVASAQQPAQGGAPGGNVPDGKIAVINTQVFPAQINELKQKYEQVDGQFKDRYEKLKQLDNQLKQMETDIRTKGPSWPADKQQQAQDEYARLKTQGTREFEDLKAEYDRTVDTATKPVRDKLYQFVEKYAGSHGIVLVLNLAGAAQTGSLAYWHPGSDITDDFVSEYNKANPVAGKPK
ncbi:MAG TPA: OmpH family outer membrane protein [Blastocatellia bacterium]|nr:OmpH family outer membrane protein [Blastocatellia bacterium]